MTGEALLFFPCFRGVLRVDGDRRVVARPRRSEHEVARDVLLAVAESRVWGSEPGRALRVALNSSRLWALRLGPLPTRHPLLHSTHVVDVARVVVVARGAQSTGAKWLGDAMWSLPIKPALRLAAL